MSVRQPSRRANRSALLNAFTRLEGLKRAKVRIQRVDDVTPCPTASHHSVLENHHSLQVVVSLVCAELHATEGTTARRGHLWTHRNHLSACYSQYLLAPVYLPRRDGRAEIH